MLQAVAALVSESAHVMAKVRRWPKNPRPLQEPRLFGLHDTHSTQSYYAQAQLKR